MTTLTATLTTSTSPTVDLDSIRIDPVWALRVPAAFAIRKRLLPLCKLDEIVVVAAAQPIDATLDKALRAYLKTEYRLVMAEPEALRLALARVYDTLSLDGRVDTLPSSGSRPTVQAAADDAVGWCDELLQAATLRGASDIHLVPGEKVLRIHLRVDGQLEPYRELPIAHHSSIVSRLKVLAGLDIAEKRAAQDGRITSQMKSSKRKMDIRVATLPTRYGERVTLRLLTPQDAQLSLASLGMRFPDLEKFRRATARPHGLILLTGPTGSGKSTTLYVAIEQLLETHGGNVITIEDPVEYEIRGASQVEVDSADKVNFSKALRSVLRHDPDVVMIGEIRDAETASIAVKASLTGHLVFSTLHTNNATGVVTRLIDLGIEPFLIAATLRLSVAQRLVRRLCPHCRRERPLLETEALTLRQPKLAGRPVYEPGGCIACAGRGYTGRIGLFEIVESSETFANLISSGATEDALNEHLRQRGETLLLDDGLEKILDGRTTVQEVVSAVTTW